MRKIVIDRTELNSVYETMQARDAAKYYGVCIQTFYNMLDQAKIERKRPGIKRGENISFEVVG